MDLEKLFDRYNRATREQYNLETTWYRHLVTIAAGILAITVSFQTSTPTSLTAQYLLLTTWLSLVVSICAGVAATYAQVSAQKSFIDSFEEQILKPLAEGANEMPLVAVQGTPRIWLVYSRYVMVFSLVLSILLLAAYGATAIISKT